MNGSRRFHLPIQSAESRAEQNGVLTQVLNSICNRFCSPYLIYSNKNEIILGPHGSDKSHLSSIVLSYALCNCLVSMITSLATRRANQLGGEYIHRLFGIPVTNIEVHAIVDEALAKLTDDPKRQFLLSKLQF